MKQDDRQTNIRLGLTYFYAAGIATGIAGLLHLRLFSMGLERGINEIGIFFLVSGILQLFWVVPMIRRWRNASVDCIMGHYKGSKSDYTWKGVPNKFHEYS